MLQPDGARVTNIPPPQQAWTSTDTWIIGNPLAIDERPTFPLYPFDNGTGLALPAKGEARGQATVLDRLPPITTMNTGDIAP